MPHGTERTTDTGENREPERKRAEAEFNRRRQELQAILDIAPIGINIAEDRECTVIRGNRMIAELLGMDPGENLSKSGPVPGKTTYRVFADGKELEPHELPMQRAAAEDIEVSDQLLTIARGDGSRVEVLVNARPIRDGAGEIRGAVGICLDVTGLREAERAAARSEEQFRALVRAGTDVVYRMSPDWGEMRYLEGREFIADTHEPSRSWLETYVDPEDRPLVLAAIEGAIREKSVFELEHRIRRVDGSLGWASSRAIPILDAGGEVVEWLGTVGDITARREAEAERERLIEQLKDADRLKDEFLAMLAHELRNPLAAISNAVQLAGRSRAAEHQEWSRAVVEAQTKNLSRMIDDLLDVSRITRGKIELRREPVVLRDVVESAVEVVRPLVAEREHRLVLDLNPTPLWVDGDPTRLEQVAVNLLNNAAKYTHSGGRITVTSYVEGPEAVLVVEDTGEGMPPELLARAFDMFAQGDRTAARGEGGLGIGLTLVRSLVELHGGSVRAESEGPGRGTRVTVRLPLALPGVVPPAEGEPLPEAVTVRCSRILVVDDGADSARGMARFLTLLGHDVRVAYDGPSAIEAARELRPEFVLLDIGLPGMDGYEVARRLRREPSCRASVIIAVSGYGREEDRRRSKEAGFDHHLVKPVVFDTLVSLINQPA